MAYMFYMRAMRQKTALGLSFRVFMSAQGRTLREFLTMTLCFILCQNKRFHTDYQILKCGNTEAETSFSSQLADIQSFCQRFNEQILLLPFKLLSYCVLIFLFFKP